MRKLIALFALLLSASAAQAQADKASLVTKLPGEEKLSVRERAERDFLMPVRRKKLAETPKATASAELESTAAPELDATAHYTEATEARPEEVASSTRTERHAALRHRSRAVRLAAPRHTRATAAHRSVRHSSKATKASKVKKTAAAKRTKAVAHHAKAVKATAHRSRKKEAVHKAKTKRVAATSHHAVAKKKVSKTKVKTRKNHRR